MSILRDDRGRSVPVYTPADQARTSEPWYRWVLLVLVGCMPFEIGAVAWWIYKDEVGTGLLFLFVPYWTLLLLWFVGYLRVRRSRARRRPGHCAACNYSLLGLAREPDGCRICPECGAAWRRA